MTTTKDTQRWSCYIVLRRGGAGLFLGGKQAMRPYPLRPNSTPADWASYFWKLVKHKQVWDYIGKYPTSFCLPLHLVLLTLARKLSLMPWTSVSFSSKSLLVPSAQVLFMLSLLLFILFYHTQVHTQKYSCTKCSDCMILLTVAILLP